MSSIPEVRSVAKIQPRPSSAEVTPSSWPPENSVFALNPVIAATPRVAGSTSARTPVRPAGTRTLPVAGAKRRSSKPIPADPPGISIDVCACENAAARIAPPHARATAANLMGSPPILILKQLLSPSIRCYMHRVGRKKTPTHPAGRGPEGAHWYLLIHQLPPEPLYLRAKIRQRLTRVGAVALKNAVYVLPRREECLDDFQWIVEEAVAGGGEAYVCEAEFLEGKTEQALVDQFRAERDLDYAALSKEIRDWKKEKDGELP